MGGKEEETRERGEQSGMLGHLRREQRVLMVTDGLLSLFLPTVSLTEEGLSYKRFVCKGHCPLIDMQTQDTDQQGACKV